MAVSDIIAAQPGWIQSSARWIEAFDDIDLPAIAAFAKQHCKIVPRRASIATLLYGQLSPTFGPPAPRIVRRPIKRSNAMSQSADQAA